MAIYSVFPLNMVIFHSYVKLPEGNIHDNHFHDNFHLKKHESCEIPIIGDAETHRNAMASCHEKKRGKEGSKGNPMFDLNAKNSHAIFNGLKDWHESRVLRVLLKFRALAEKGMRGRQCQHTHTNHCSCDCCAWRHHPFPACCMRLCTPDSKRQLNHTCSKQTSSEHLACKLEPARSKSIKKTGSMCSAFSPHSLHSKEILFQPWQEHGISGHDGMRDISAAVDSKL